MKLDKHTLYAHNTQYNSHAWTYNVANIQGGQKTDT